MTRSYRRRTGFAVRTLSKSKWAKGAMIGELARWWISGFPRGDHMTGETSSHPFLLTTLPTMTPPMARFATKLDNWNTHRHIRELQRKRDTGEKNRGPIFYDK
mgnify:CR=1 FL=1